MGGLNCEGCSSNFFLFKMLNPELKKVSKSEKESQGYDISVEPPSISLSRKCQKKRRRKDE